MSDNQVTEWRPNKRQEEFLAMPATVFEGFYGGAAGGGKSEVLLMDPIVKGYTDYAAFHGIIFRRTFPQLQESLIPRAKRLYGWNGVTGMGAVYNDNRKEFKFPSGATIRFSYLETDDHAHDHQTAEYHYIAFDELTHFTEYQYLYMTSRIRTADKRLVPYIRSGSNPGGLGHTWVFHRFVKHAESGHKLLRMKLPNGKMTKLMFIPAKLTDNPVVMQEDPDYINRLEMLPEAERRALIHGDWHAYAGQVFTEFRAKRLMGEPENALHVIEPFSIPTWWPKIIAIDWGWDAMTWAGWAALSPDDVAFVYREYAQRKVYIADWGSEIARLSQFDGNIKAVVLDPSAWANRGEKKQIWEQFRDASGMMPQQANNDRISGKLLMHEFLRWQPKKPRYIPPEGYSEILYQKIWRMYGEKKAREYQKMFEPEAPEKNLPKLRIFNHCETLIQTIPALVHAEPSTKTGKRPEDVKEFNGDDPYDGGRYLIKRIQDYLHEAQAEHRDRVKVAKIMGTFEESGSYTDLYRNMEKYEAAKRAGQVLAFDRFRGIRRTARRLGERVH